ncbi:MAG TPA: Glu-tRNA(Gln) amidotransferase subunit GatE [Phycisphaerae bacterium]|jgi:glutamyl-tRNA(Gln) amidotransferase subunit E|nr:Glu-tRNA(Gln) amidotransferase subunit GatE [Phycisphaerae bacterium]
MSLRFKPFEEMTRDDYAQIGLKCGLEVHQQLLTETKLFCRCPAGRYSDDYDTEILRHMRPTLSELGEYDGTALMEKKTRKNIYYRIHHSTVCTYEFDDTPPFLIDDDALDITLELCLLFDLNIVSELHIARKQYLDGSIPAGFQRTGIVGVTGALPYGDRTIGIRQLSIEEDACREVSDVGHDRVYLTDRLGMPLIEVVTEPDMCTPDEAADVCQLIRRICRSTGKVRTGYGAARQDVNVSVAGGTRVEIKGVPQIWRIPRLVYNEAHRQCALLEIREELRRRGVTPETFQYSAHDVTRLTERVQWEPVRAAVEAGLRVKCVVLKRFGGLLNTVTQERTTFAKEFADRVRVIACLTRLPNITHSDTATEALAARDWENLRKRTRAAADDALLLVWGSEEDTETACNEIAIRAREATLGVPSDTRQPLKDGTTGFERVLPGAARMYPDTDLPPLAISAQRVARIRAGLPERVWNREQRLRELGVPGDTLVPLLTSRHGELFFRLVRDLKVDAKLAAVVLVQRLKAWRRAGLDVNDLSDADIYAAFEAYANRRLTREGLLDVLEYVLRNHFAPCDSAARVQAAMSALGYGHVSETDPSALVSSTVNGLEPSQFANADDMQRYAMGVLMRDLRGRVEGRQVAELVSAALRQKSRAMAKVDQG